MRIRNSRKAVWLLLLLLHCGLTNPVVSFAAQSQSTVASRHFDQKIKYTTINAPTQLRREIESGEFRGRFDHDFKGSDIFDFDVVFL